MTSHGTARPSIHIVPFDGSLCQCEDIRFIAIDAFGSESYPAGCAIRARLERASGRAWLIRPDGASQTAGFLATFPTHPLSGPRVEFDLLAVRSEAQGRGLAGRLMDAALDAWGGSPPGMARALIREGNIASERVFGRAGFAPADAWSELLIGQAENTIVASSDPGIEVQPAKDDDLSALARRWPALFEGAPLASRLRRDDFGLLVARRGAGIVGFVELLVVYTIPYSGVWLEHLAAVGDDPQVLRALASAVRRWAAGRELEMAGAAIDLAREPARDALRRAGYEPAGIYRYFHRPTTSNRE